MAMKLLPVYVTPEQAHAIHEAARHAGMSASAWLRVLALREIASDDPLLAATGARSIEVPLFYAATPRRKRGTAPPKSAKGRKRTK